MLALALPLILTQVLQITNSAPSDNAIASWDLVNSYQHARDFDGCQCREYTSIYATCYKPETCFRFPREFQTKLDRFRLATTGIENITAGDLDNLTNVKNLELEANTELRWIENGSFANMTNLSRLSVSYNPKLHYLEEDVFEGLVNLRDLSIRRNGFESIKNFSLSLKSEFMPNLRRLELNELRCVSIDRDDFKNLNGSVLEELDLVDSQVEYIHPQAFLPLKKLRALNLGENLINTTTLVDVLEELIGSNVTLEKLSLHGWGFKKNPPRAVLEVVAKSTLRELVLSKNQFDVISDDTFPSMPHLEVLHLSNVLVSNFTSGAFSGLPNLKSLCLAENKFPSIPKGIFPKGLKRLDLSQEARYFTLENDTFENMTGLETLDLSSNNIRKIPNGSFQGLINLRRLLLRNSTVFHIEANSFRNLRQLQFLSLERNPFPNRTFESAVFEGLQKLEELELGYCGIASLKADIFIHLKSLTRLDLKGNELVTISPQLFSAMPDLERLNLGRNRLVVWQKRLLERNSKMKMLQVFENKLTYFTRAMLEDFSDLESVDLSGNSFSCGCDDFKSFSRFNSSVVDKIWSLLTNISTAKCAYPYKYENHSLIEYFNNVYLGDECMVTLLDILIDYLIPTAILLLLILAVVVTIYVYRWHIRYWIFLTKMFLSKRAQFSRNLNLQGHDNYLYDAFVSYSSEDRNFVVRLVGMLENYEPFLKLCVYERDFEIGTFISENVLECVARSRKTLLVISNSYIKSQWCRWEAQVAENHRLFFENEYGECVNDSIIMIKLGNISQNHLSPMLKYLMKTRIYLQWDADEAKQKHFWEKLRNALAPPVNPYATTKKTEVGTLQIGET